MTSIRTIPADPMSGRSSRPSPAPSLVVDTRPVVVLRPPRFSPWDMFGQVGELRRYGDLLLTLTSLRIRVRYKQSALGPLWAVLQPFALMLIYTVIFSLVARIPTDGVPFALFSFAALLPWTAFTNAVGNATSGLVGHSQMVTKVYFPREIIPLSYVAAAVIDLLIAGAMLAGLLLWYGVAVTATALWALPILMIMLLLALGLSLLLSAMQVRYRDIGVGLPLLFQVWMFATPVIYPLDAVQESARLGAVAKFAYLLNPMVGVVENFRRVVVSGATPDLRSIGVSAAIALVLLPFAYSYFKRTESTMADHI